MVVKNLKTMNNKFDTRVVLTQSENTGHIFADFGGNQEHLITIFASTQEEINSIGKHICVITDFAKALYMWTKIQDSKSLDVDEVTILQKQLIEQMALINSKLGE